MRYIIASPGLPEDESGFFNVEPTACVPEGALKRMALELMEIDNMKCRIVMAPVDFLRLHHIQSWAIVEMDASLDDGRYSEITINDTIRIRGISVKSKPSQPL